MAHGSLLPSGADEHCAMNFTFGPGRFASSFVSIGTTSTCEGVIIGRNGWIRVHNSLMYVPSHSFGFVWIRLSHSRSMLLLST